MIKVFDMGSMACQDVQAWVVTAVYGTGADAEFVPAPITDGAFVKLGNLAADTVYNGEKDWNTYQATAPDSDEYTASDIVVIDLAEVSGGTIAGNYYKIGRKLVDLEAEADRPVRARKLFKGDKFWLGAGNFTEVPEVGAYANLTADDVVLTPADEASADKFTVKIVAAKPITLGTLVPYTEENGYEKEYLVEVM